MFRPSEDQVIGCMVGAALGDALGFPHEFNKATHMVDLEPWDSVRGVKCAKFSDDTQMSIVAARVLSRPARSEQALGEDVAQAFVQWSRDPEDGHRAPGGACMSGCSQLAAKVPWRRAGGATAGGCGAIMRSHPYALRWAHQPSKAIRIAVEHGNMTHRDPLSDAAVAALVAGVCSSLRRRSATDVAAAMITAAAHYDIKTSGMLAWTFDQTLPRMRGGSQAGQWEDADREVFGEMRGWAGHEAACAALWCFLRFPDDPVMALRLGANTPGDSDSIASIAGALVGARVGYARLPVKWVFNLEKHVPISNLGAALWDRAHGGRRA